MSGAPPWLEAFQADFGALIRTPLDRATGTLRATPEVYAPSVQAETVGTEGLAVYNRQYWFRLFTAIQTSYPLTTRLLGAWELNGKAMAFLRDHPPTGWDLEAAGQGFDAWLAQALPAELDRPRGAVLEAARVDAAWSRVLRAPAVQPWAPSAADAPRLLDARLLLSPAAALVEERWPLVSLRASLFRDPGAEVALGPPHAAPRIWVVSRRSGGVLTTPLEPRQGELYALLREGPVGEALAILERSCPEEERAALPEQTRRWLASGVALGLWSGLEQAQSQTTQL